VGLVLCFLCMAERGNCDAQKEVHLACCAGVWVGCVWLVLLAEPAIIIGPADACSLSSCAVACLSGSNTAEALVRPACMLHCWWSLCVVWCSSCVV
jgi:hypothetical protein